MRNQVDIHDSPTGDHVDIHDTPAGNHIDIHDSQQEILWIYTIPPKKTKPLFFV